MSLKKYQELIEEYNLLIKSGKTLACRNQFNKLRLHLIPRKYRVEFSRIAARLNLPVKSFQILRDIVFTEKINIIPTDEEIMQIGMAFRQLGALAYAERLFKKVDENHQPIVLLNRAAILFNSWDYSSAIPLIEKFIVLNKEKDLEKLIGLVNLAAALTFVQDFEKLPRVLEEAQLLCHRLNHHLFFANLLEIEAQYLIHQGRLSQAKTLLQKADSLIEDEGSIYKLFIQKWLAIIEIMQRVDLVNLRKLDQIREKAISLKHWETIRDCDFYFAVLKKDKYLFHRLYFGTPYLSYRQRLGKAMNDSTVLPETFEWSGNFPYREIATRKKIEIDLSSNTITLGNKKFDQFHSMAQLLKCLCADFYLPQKPVNIFLKMFPDELVDPSSAIQRIFNAVSQLNSTLKSEKIPLKIEMESEGYKLNFFGPVIIKIPQSIDFSNRQNYFNNQLQKTFSESSFTSIQVVEALGMPKRTIQRLLNAAVENDHVVSFKEGQRTLYRLKQV